VKLDQVFRFLHLVARVELSVMETIQVSHLKAMIANKASENILRKLSSKFRS